MSKDKPIKKIHHSVNKPSFRGPRPNNATPSVEKPSVEKPSFKQESTSTQSGKK